jgi:predicted lactoylglutathione lyase
MDSKQKTRLDELKEKMNKSEDLTTDEKNELDELIEKENEVGGNPLTQPSK